MLYDGDGKQIRTPSREPLFRSCRPQVSDEAYAAVLQEVHRYFDGRDTVVAGYIPGPDWTGEVWRPLYNACGRDPELTALFFGLIVWRAVQSRSDAWRLWRIPCDDRELAGLTYFRRDAPEPTVVESVVKELVGVG